MSGVAPVRPRSAPGPPPVRPRSASGRPRSGPGRPRSSRPSRAVVDEVLPPVFLSDPLVARTGGDIIEQAKILLSRSHGVVRLGRVWGPGDGRPVQDLKNDIRLLLQEYFMTGDLGEAARCIQDLHVPMFHHEVRIGCTTKAYVSSPPLQCFFPFSHTKMHTYYGITAIPRAQIVLMVMPPSINV